MEERTEVGKGEVGRALGPRVSGIRGSVDLGCVETEKRKASKKPVTSS